jgi:hypothetical protein
MKGGSLCKAPGSRRDPRASRLPVAEDVLGRQRAVVQYPGDEDALRMCPEKDDVPAVFQAA